jgi:hypothetical protein
MNNFKILAIEGMQGVGKTTQARLIKDFLELEYSSYKFQVFTINPDGSDVIQKHKEIDTFLEKHNNIAILDGTVASAVILSDVKRGEYGFFINNMDLEVKSYLNLIHKYRTINSLIVPESISYLKDRTGLNMIYLDTYLKGFRYFENSQIASNLNYIRTYITEKDKILVVLDKIKKDLNL